MKKEAIFVSGLINQNEMKEILSETSAGIETIMLSIAQNLDHLQETVAKESACLGQLGYPKLTVHGPFLDLNPACYDSLIRRVTMGRFEQAYQAAGELGAEKIIFHSGIIPSVYFTEGWAERAADFWMEFLQGKSGLVVCMENVLDEWIWPVREVARRVAHPDFGLCLDIGHAHCYGREAVMEWAGQLSPWIRHVHVHDNDGKRDSHLALGDGTLPYETVIGYLDEVCPGLTWTIECNTLADIRKTYGAMRRAAGFLNLLGKHGITV